MRAAILTVSDRAARGERPDESGPTVGRMAERAGFEIVARAVVPDDRARITQALRRWSDANEADLVLTTGGTGLGPRDVTPEATLETIERVVPGIPEAMRATGMRSTPYAALSRQVAGVRGRTLIVNLPGSPRAVQECLDAVLDTLPHAIALLQSR